MQKKQWIPFITLAALLILAIMVPVAGAYETYTDCASCHGNFTATPYSALAAAKAANPVWTGGLHNTHRNSSTATPQGMLNSNCNACHSGTSRTPVFMNLSAAAAPFNQSCTGCHDGPGLRAHHVNSGSDTCYDCHSDPAPDPENVLRPVFSATFGTTSGTTRVNDPCSSTTAGFEGRLADVTTVGLDNDGNLLYDQNDPACAPASAPKISVSPTTLTFGNQATGSSSAAQTVTISNTGTATLNVTGITNSNTTDFTVTAPSTPFNVAAGGSQTFSVVFGPVSTGAKSATITVSSNAGSPTVSATGTGTVPPAPVLSVSPATLTYANQNVGTTSATQTVTLSNTGNASLTVNGLINSNATDFVVAGVTVPFNIAASGSQTFTVAFKPGSAGAKSATISITSNGGNGSVTANGTGVTPATPVLSVSPATLTYANQNVGTTSATQTVTLSNTGNASLTVNSVTNGNTTDFVVAGVTVPFNIAASGSQTFTVAFKPGSAGVKSATISITSNGGNGSVTANGTGVTPATPVLSVSPATLTYANQNVGTTSATQTVTLSNTGNASLTVNSITNGNTTDFVVAGVTVPFNIAASGSQTFTVAFKPGSAGAKSATISITSNGGNGSVTANGTGVTPATPVLSVSPATLTYANQNVGTTSATQTVTLSNTGNASLTVNSITNGNTTDFVVAGVTVPFNIAASGSQTFTVAFKPGSAGAKSATISITSNGGNGSVTANGTGVAIVTQPILSVSPASLTFANITVNTTTSKTVTISNTGNAPLNITDITKTGSAAFSFSPASFSPINAGASATLTVTYAPTVAGTDPGSTINITSNGGNASINLTGSAVQPPATGTGDVALVKLTVPSKITAKVGEARDYHVSAGATTTSKKIKATVTLQAAADNVKVTLNSARKTEDLKATETRKFEFEAKISCTKSGTWPITWTAQIAAPSNSNPANDTITGTTQVVCSGSTEEQAEESDSSDDRRVVYQYRVN